MILPVNDIRYSVILHQDDPTLPYLLMLHGFMGSSRVFDHLIPQLKDFCNPVTPDLPGHGETESPESIERYSTSCLVKDLNDIISKLRKGPLYLHGYSMGGRLALQYATLHAENLAGLILESANPGIQEADERAERMQKDEKRASAIESDFKKFLEEWERLPLFANGIDLPDEGLETYRKVQHGQDPGAMASCLRQFGTGVMPPAWDRLDGLTLPVLLLAGELDDKYCTICRDMNKLIPDSGFQVIGNAGHRVHLENPDVFVDRIRNFVT